MALWAKVDVDMPTDPKLFGQPVATRYLWLCLICLAKKQDEAGVIRGYDADLLAGALNLPRKAVLAALTHFELEHMIEPGTLRLLNFAKRQGDTDEREKAAKRQREKYVRDKRETSRQPHAEPHVSTGVRTKREPHANLTTDLDLDLEKEQEKEKEKKDQVLSSFSLDPEIARESQTDATPTEQAKLVHALNLDRKARRG